MTTTQRLLELPAGTRVRVSETAEIRGTLHCAVMRGFTATVLAWIPRNMDSGPFVWVRLDRTSNRAFCGNDTALAKWAEQTVPAQDTEQRYVAIPVDVLDILASPDDDDNVVTI